MSNDDKDFDGIRYNPKDKPPLPWKIIHISLFIWGMCFMAYYLFSGWSSHGEYDAIKKAKEARLATDKLKGSEGETVFTHEEKRTARLAGAAKQDFAARCAACHGADGKGGIGPDLTRKEFKYGKTAPEVARTIVEGRPGGMPAFKNDLSHDKIEGLVEYVLSLK